MTEKVSRQVQYSERIHVNIPWVLYFKYNTQYHVIRKLFNITPGTQFNRGLKNSVYITEFFRSPLNKFCPRLIWIFIVFLFCKITLMIQKRFALIYPRVDDKPHSTRVKESSQSKIGQIISSVNAMRNVEDCLRIRNRAIINTSFKIKTNATISLTCNKSR